MKCRTFILKNYNTQIHIISPRILYRSLIYSYDCVVLNIQTVDALACSFLGKLLLYCENINSQTPQAEYVCGVS